MTAADARAAARKRFEEGPIPLSLDDNVLTFRHYYSSEDGGFVSEGRRKGMDPPSQQLKELYKVMSKGVFDGGNGFEVVMIVRPCPQ